MRLCTHVLGTTRRAGSCALALAALTGTPSAAQTPPEPALRHLEERLAQALVKRDTARFNEILDPEFVLRGSPDVDRATWIDNAVTLCWGDAATISDFRVIEADGSRAITALVLTTTRDPVSCERATVRSLITDVWRFREGRWRLVLRHSGPAGDLAAQFAREAAPPPLWEGSAELSLVDTGGNTETQTLGAGGVLIWRPGPWTTEARTAFIRSVTLDVLTARSFSAAVRQARTITERIDLFGRFEYLGNEFAGIDHRVSLDTGMGYKILTGPVHTLRADAGVGYSHEARLNADDLSFALTTVGAVYEWRLSKNVSLTDNALFTASLEHGEDWRFRNALGVATSLSRLLAVRLSHELAFLKRASIRVRGDGYGAVGRTGGEVLDKEAAVDARLNANYEHLALFGTVFNGGVPLPAGGITISMRRRGLAEFQITLTAAAPLDRFARGDQKRDRAHGGSAGSSRVARMERRVAHSRRNARSIESEGPQVRTDGPPAPPVRR